MRVLVDGANVVGSRPDGWWRDRAGAARRLIRALAALIDREPEWEIAVVLEGAARAGAAPGSNGRLTVVHAPGAGDDEIVRRSADFDVVVTADRALRDRVRPVRVVGPSWLQQHLPP